VSAPAIRSGNTYTARLFYDPDPLRDGQQDFRFRSDGPDLANHVIVERLIHVSRASHDAAKRPNWRMPATTVSGFAELAREVRSVGSPDLVRFVDDLEAVIGRGEGKSVDELTSIAAARVPPAPTGRAVPPHRMGGGPVAAARPPRRAAATRFAKNQPRRTRKSAT
jgi:hypothetical protein